eukprot:scaffold669019_cov39-Prasinocladus_malaysianus.AAC.1
MRRAQDSLPCVAVLVALLCLAYGTYGFPYFGLRIPNGNSVPSEDGTGICFGVGHYNCYGGGERNPFGNDFDAAGKLWTKDLCHKDSDGDGLTNGEE